jgi:hypothetical protein
MSTDTRSMRRGARIDAVARDRSLLSTAGGTAVTKRAGICALLPIALAIGVISCSPADELGPAATVEHVAHGLADADLSVAWDAFPASYQRDMNGIAHDFAGAVDRELWNRTFAVLSKLTRLLKEKEAFILEHPFVAKHLAESAGENADWSRVVEIIDLLVTCELANVEQLAALDIGSFLDGTGNRLLELLIEASALSSAEHRAEFEAQRETLLALRASVESTEGGVASVRIEVPGEDATVQRFVRVEEKWIPADLADGWANRIASAKESIASLSDAEMKSNKPAILLQMSMVDSALDTLLAAKTAEEFNAGIGAVIGMAVGAMLNPAAMMDTSASTQRDGLGSPVATWSSSGGAGTSARPQVSVSEVQRYIGQTLRIAASDGLATTAKSSRALG